MNRRTATLTAAAALLASIATLGAHLLTSTPAAATPEQPDRVVVVDKTHSTWSGVRRAAHSWSTDQLTVTTAAACDPSAYCVVVQEPRSFNRDWLGYWYPVARHVSLVQLNTDHAGARNPHTQAWVVCHELGHALGLGEVFTGAPGCMVDDWTRPDLPTTATDRDLSMLSHVERAKEGTALRFYSSAA